MAFKNEIFIFVTYRFVIGMITEWTITYNKNKIQINNQIEALFFNLILLFYV